MIISITDKVTIENSEKYILSIRINPDGLSFSLYNPSVPENYFFYEKRFDAPGNYAGSLKDFFFQHPFLSWPYLRTNILFTTPLYTLVPADIFVEKQQQQYLDFTFEKEKSQILSDRLKSPDAYLVYGVNEEMYEFCCRSLLPSRIGHYLAILVPGWSEYAARTMQNQMYVIFHPEHMDVACFDRKGLIFLNSFQGYDPDDLLYYIMYIWHRQDFNQLKDQLLITGDPGQVALLMPALYKYIARVDKVDTPSDAYLIGGEILKAPIDLISLSLCE